MGAYLDLTGKKFGKLVALELISRDHFGKAIWLCKCECGNMTRIRGDSLTTGNTKTCGCCPIMRYSVIGEIAIGITSKDRVFVFDADEIMAVKKYTWSIDNNGYVVTNLGYGKTLHLHRLIMGNIDGKVIDHISRDRLDNRKINLRHVTQQQNVQNSGMNKNNSTGYKGVYFDKQRKKYAAEIMCGRKKHYLGRFNTAREAAIAYNRKAIKLFGEYAFLNVV